MAVYNPKSRKAEEFINDKEILDTLDYAEKNKDNLELIDKILEKAKERKEKNLYRQKNWMIYISR